MATSGSVTFRPKVEEIIAESFERCGIDPQTRTGHHAKAARRSLNLLFSEFANRGINYWTVTQNTLTLSAGTTNYTLLALQQENACVNAESYIGTLEKNIFEMINIYLKSKDRDAVAEMLKFNKPFDEQILAWVMSSLNTEKIAWIDAKVKRKWSSDYFFELLDYAHNGMPISFSPPRRRAYDKRPSICKKIGMRPDEYEMLNLLKQDPDFEHYMYTKLSSVERVKLGVKKGKAKKPTIANSRLEDYF